MKEILILIACVALYGGCARPDRSEQMARRLMMMWETGATTGLEKITANIIYDESAMLERVIQLSMRAAPAG